MQLHRCAGARAGVLLAVLLTALATAAPAGAHPGRVTVRVEGAKRTLLPATVVTTRERAVVKDGVAAHGCLGFSPAGALELATRGAWTVKYTDGLGYFITGIKGERHDGGSQFWSLWVNGRQSTEGICGGEVEGGDSVLLYVDRCDFDAATKVCANAPVLPLDLQAPSRARVGRAATVTAYELTVNGDRMPLAGVRVRGGGIDARTNAAGRATVRFRRPGVFRLTATKPGLVRSAGERVQVRR